MVSSNKRGESVFEFIESQKQYDGDTFRDENNGWRKILS